MRYFATAVLATALMIPATAKAEGFHGSENCLEILGRVSDADKVLLAGWLIGYLDKQNGNASIVRMDNARVVLSNVAGYCARNPGVSLLEVVHSSKRSSPDAPGSSAHARAFLHQFLDQGADRVALTAGMRPTEDEIRAVYTAPLADALVGMYREMFKPGVAIGPNPGQTEVLLWGSTTDGLRAGVPELADFPGGYKEVRAMMQGGFPIYRFKFVEPGQRSGMAFDGLIFINNRYVLMPKPWRAMQ
ncbi:MAG: hypothetical protein AAFY25_08990 [Pseudomonadota bacterium]